MTEFSVWTDIDVRFRDTDAMGHVNNAVYLTYLEVGRQEYWKRLTPDNYVQVPFVVAHVSIDFRSPATVGEILRVFLRTTRLGRSTFDTAYVIRERDTGRVVVEARSVQVTYDYEKARAMPVPDWLRRAIETLEGRSLGAEVLEGGNPRAEAREGRNPGAQARPPAAS